MKRIWKQAFVFLMAAILTIGTLAVPARASWHNTVDNYIITQTSVSKGRIGKNMTVSFRVTPDNDGKWEDVYVRFSEPRYYVGPGEEEEMFPFEGVSSTFEEKYIGTVTKNGKSTSLTAKLREDLAPGYYGVEIEVRYKDGNYEGQDSEWVNIYVSAGGSGTDEPEPVEKQVSFVLGEGGSTPSGNYPDAMDFTVNMRNAGLSDARDVTVQMVLNKNSTEFPFVISEGNYDRAFDLISAGETVQLGYNMNIREDAPSGDYEIKVNITYRDSAAGSLQSQDQSFWVHIKNEEMDKKNEEPTEPEEEPTGRVLFTLGEGQGTPYGVYPNVMNYSINMRNAGLTDAYDVTVKMVLDRSSDVFPFEINDGSYDRMYGTVAVGETVQLPYSMAIREDVYSGYYSLNFKISYREKEDGDLLSQDATFWVKIKNKEHEEEEDQSPTGENSRSYARVLVDSYETNPEKIIAGEEFQLIVRMKNASDDIEASNILLDLSSDTASSGGAVFTTASGASSYVINHLAPGEVYELILDMQALAGVDQRTYSLTFQETYDSPEYKNAKAEIKINIPVFQIARMNTGTIDVMPSDINVGSESNIMFTINNTGKVRLYNVNVAFEADSINRSETYVGNIEPGQSGNVDAMVQGAAPTTDDGKVKIIITYEDEYGDVQEPVEKELTLFVNEPYFEEPIGDIEVGGFEMEPEVQLTPVQKVLQLVQQYLMYIIPAAVIVVLIIVIALVRWRKKKKAAQKDLEELEDI